MENEIRNFVIIAHIDPVRNRARAYAPEGPVGWAVSNGVDHGSI